MKRFFPLEFLKFYKKTAHQISNSAQAVEPMVALDAELLLGPASPAKLTTENLHEYAQAIEGSTLPTTIRDFIGIARALAVRFIWVDAYCIVQDSDDNKHTEIGNMGEIYKKFILDHHWF